MQRLLPAVGAGALALVSVVAFGSGASASHAAKAQQPRAMHQAYAAVNRPSAAQTGGCRFSQTDNDTGGRIDSTYHYDFGKGRGIEDFQTDDDAIDDFQCNSKEPTVVVHTVTAWGYDDNYAFGTFEVTIYTWNGGTPVGAVVCSGPDRYSTSSGPPGIVKYVIKFGHKCTLSKHTKYWLDIHANDFCYHECSYWSWTMLTPSQFSPAYWSNPNGGWHRGCQTWGTLSDCYTKDNVAYDLAFAI